MSLRILGGRLRVGRNDEAFEVDVPSLNLASGSLTALVGPSGAGKTTVLELVGLMRTPDALDALDIDGRDARDLALQGGLSACAAFRSLYVTYVVQSGGVLPFLSARENALAGLRATGSAVDAAALARLEAGAEALGIAGALEKQRAQLSGGERRRVGLLRALVAPRRLVLVDEPTTALDGKSADSVISALKTLALEHGSTVLIVTHDERRAREAGFQIYELDLRAGGLRRVLQEGSA